MSIAKHPVCLPDSTATQVVSPFPLFLSVLSGQFTISVSRGSGLGGGFPQVVQNMSAIDRYTDLELYCTGGIGKSQSTQIQWYWRQGRNLMFTVC